LILCLLSCAGYKIQKPINNKIVTVFGTSEIDSKNRVYFRIDSLLLENKIFKNDIDTLGISTGMGCYVITKKILEKDLKNKKIRVTGQYRIKHWVDYPPFSVGRWGELCPQDYCIMKNAHIYILK
jgi:hypothetical protein